MIIPGTMNKLSANSIKINTLLKTVGVEVNEISSAIGDICRKMKESRIKEIKIENEELEKKVNDLTRELRNIRTTKGIPQIPATSTHNMPCTKLADESVTVTQEPICDEKPNVADEKSEGKAEKSKKVKEKKLTTPAQEPEKEEDIHFGRLDIRVGQIVTVEKHPNADSLYVEQVDVGESKLRTIVSGLVNHVPIDQMKNRKALFLCNLKPAKMRGILSEGMIMCANKDGKVEILDLPSICQVGSYVTVPGYERNPDPQLNPKKKVWEQIQVDLKTNEKKEACYKGIVWNVNDQGTATSLTLAEAAIK